MSIIIDLTQMAADTPADWDIIYERAREAIIREFEEEK